MLDVLSFLLFVIEVMQFKDLAQCNQIILPHEIELTVEEILITANTHASTLIYSDTKTYIGPSGDLGVTKCQDEGWTQIKSIHICHKARSPNIQLQAIPFWNGIKHKMCAWSLVTVI